jgi:atypical dual specificity phosphatase
MKRLGAMVRGALHAAGLVDDVGQWVSCGPPIRGASDAAEPRVRACAYPRSDAALARLRALDVRVLVNLHARAHAPARLAAHGLCEVHVPVADFGVPTVAQLERALAALGRCHAEGVGVALHCGGGVGRTGTVLACHLVREGWTGAAAIAHVRAARPGAVETSAQVAFVTAYERARRHPHEHN